MIQKASLTCRVCCRSCTDETGGQQVADLARTDQLIEEHGFDGLLVVDPDNFAYFAGTTGFPVTMWRRAGPTSIVIVPGGGLTFVVPDSREADIQLLHPSATILTHPLWMERVDATPHLAAPVDQIIARAVSGRDATRFETYDQGTVLRLIRSAVETAGLLGKRIGMELESAPALDVENIRSVLGGTRLLNSSPLVRELRMIKTATEIEQHRLAVRITEAGITGSLVGLDERTSAFDIQARFRDAVGRVVVAECISGFESATTTLNLGPYLWGPRHDPFRPA